MPEPALGKQSLTPVQWLICGIASIGFAFDIYELLMLPLIVRPALLELVGQHVTPGSPEFSMWVGRLFFLPAFVGGIFGLLGGYLTDRLGRRRVLTWSILLYAFSAFAAGFSTSIWMLLFFRCTTFIGVCVEFVAAVAWLAELFENPERREKVLGYTQAFSSIGGLLVAFAFGLCVKYALSFPAVPIPDVLYSIFGGNAETLNFNAPWRYTLMSGLIPAIPLIVIRPFLPESPKWQEMKNAGSLKRPSLAALFQPALRKTTIVTALMFACSYGAAFGALQHIQRIIPGNPEVKEEVKERMASDEVKQMVAKHLDSDAIKKKLEGKTEDEQKEIRKKQETIIRKRETGRVFQANAANVTKVQEVGGLFGRFLLALLIVRIASRQTLLRYFLIPGLLIVPLVFGYVALNSMTLLYVGIFFCGLLTVGQFSFWGNYLPTAYPLHLRGTGESFAANIGGRMIGTSFAWVTATLSVQDFIPGESAPAKLAMAATIVGLFVYVVGFGLSFFLPEPAEAELPE